jgi:hypothetical protein
MSSKDTTATVVQPQASSAACELLIGITPHWQDVWIGTRAQLISEGVVSANVDWPDGVGHVAWEEGEFDYWLVRHRPIGFRGPRKALANVDCWCLYRNLIARRGTFGAAARIHELKRALEREIWLQTFDAWLMDQRASEARKDPNFQAFRETVTGLRMVRNRWKFVPSFQPQGDTRARGRSSRGDLL